MRFRTGDGEELTSLQGRGIGAIIAHGLATTAAILIAAAGVTSFITAAFGIGGGVALLAVMALLVPPAVLIPVHGVSNVGRAAIMLKHVRVSALLAFGLGSLLGVALGGMVVVALPPSWMQIGLAAFILYSVWGPKPQLAGARGHGIALSLGGAISSFLTMFFGATGPFVAAIVKVLKLDRLEHVGTFSALMVLQHGVKIMAFGFLGFAFAPWAPLLAVMIGAGFIGTLIGRAVLQRMKNESFHLVLNIVLSLLALRLLWAGAAELTR